MHLKELRRRILEHPEYDWSVAEMARQMYLSESYFSPLYRKCFGITPNQYKLQNKDFSPHPDR